MHGRKATAFIPKKAAAPNARKPSSRAAASSHQLFPAFSSFSFAKVEFEADAQDVEEVEVDNTPQRKVKGRQATAFVPKAPSHGASVGDPKTSDRVRSI